MVAIKIIAIIFKEWDLKWIHGEVQKDGLTAVVTSLCILTICQFLSCSPDNIFSVFTIYIFIIVLPFRGK